MAPHSSTLAWKIPWTEEPGRLQSMGSLKVGHDWATSLWLFTFMHWRKWQPTPVFLPGESQGWRGLVGCRLWGRTESDTTEVDLAAAAAAMRYLGFPGGSDGKESACSAQDLIWSLGQEDPLEKGMATHFSISAWRIPWTEEPGGLQSIRSQRVRHAWVTEHICMHTVLKMKTLNKCLYKKLRVQ